MPPTEYDPTTGDDTGELVEVGPAGVVETWAWVARPLRKHPLSVPFAWALIRLDGADTACSTWWTPAAPTPSPPGIG